MIIKIPYHSFIDVITNSSTEIFINANGKSIEMAREFINELLEVAGSKETFDDLFEATLEVDDLEEYWNEHGENFLDDLEVEYLDDDDNRIESVFEEYFKKIENEPELSLKFTEMLLDSEINMDSSIVLTTKNDDKKTIDLASRFQSMFDIEEGYN